MATTASTSLLGLALPVTGELDGTWGTVVNDSITSLVDSAIAGTTTLSSDADVTLTTTALAANTAREAVLLWTAGGSSTRYITAPAQSKTYVVINQSSSTQSIVLRGAGPTTGVTIIKGEAAVCAWNGTDFIKVSNISGPGTFTDLTVTGNTSLGDADTDTITQAASYVTGTQLKSAKTATNTLNLAAYDVDGAAYTNLVTLTASNTPTLALTSTGVGTINNMSVGATTTSTGAFTTLSASSTVSGTGFSTYLASPPAIGGTAAAAGTFTTLASTGNTTLGDAVADTITLNGQFVTGTVLKSAQALTNTLALAAYDVDGVAYANLITLTASNTPTLALTSTGVGTLNNISVGATTASTGAFTTLSASSTVSGTGFSTYLASPPAIGGTAAAAGTFTTLTSTGNTTIGDADTDTITENASYVSGTQLKSAKAATNTLNLAAYDVDGATYTNLVTLTASNTPTLALTSTGVGTINNMSVGATTASTGAFTTLSASSTVSGTGFSTYLASPPAIGGTAAAAGTFTALSATGVATFSAGTAALPAITTTGDTNTGIYFPAADTIAFTEGGAEAMRIDSSGNVLIGTTTSPAGSKELVLGGDYIEGVVAIGNSATAKTISLANGTVQTVTLTGNCTFTMPTAVAGKSFTVILSTGAGSFTSTFTSVKWPNNTAPVITTTASRWDILSFISDGTNWYGNFAQAYQ